MGPGGLASAAPLLDRAAELETIAAAIDTTCSGSGSALLVEGVAGIGKTRLLTHACEQAARAGMKVLTARAAEFEDGYAWGVVRQLFEAEVRAASGPRPAGDAATLAALALTCGAPGGGEDSFAVLHGLYWLTADIAQQGPLLLGVDDLHWADQPSQRFIAHLARRLDGLAVLLVLTVREPRSGTPQQKTLTAALAMETSVTTLRPAALSAAACAELIGGTLGPDPAPAFQAACRELTGGNPLLLRGLLAGLAAAGLAGTGDEVPRLRRLAPGPVARSVLLQLGRMPAAALAAARAVAVLGTAATAERARRLAGLDGDACAEAISALMAERLIEGERTLRFVHPLVRSAVYFDLNPPERQRWHKRAARLLDEQGAPMEEVTVHLLAAAATGDAWVVDRLRRAAVSARARGAPDVAIQCLERALAEPPPAEIRGDVLLELGSARTFQAPVAAASHLAEALAGTTSWPRRGEIALALSQALALCGRFDAAADVLRAAIAAAGSDSSDGSAGADGGADGSGSALAMSLQAALLNAARWDIDARPAMRPVLQQLKVRADRGEQLDPQLHANLAIEFAAAGQDRHGAVRHAREALRSTPRLAPAMPGVPLEDYAKSEMLSETTTVLLFADLADEAHEWAQRWLCVAQQRGWPVASKVAATAMTLISLYRGDVTEAVAYGLEAMEGTGDMWISALATAFTVPALIERGLAGQAGALLAGNGLGGELGGTWIHNTVRHARGRLYAATADHAAAVRELLSAGERAERWGVRNPMLMAWRSDAALSLSALGDQHLAGRLLAEEIGLAREWGADRAVGVALRAAGVTDRTGRGTELLTEAVAVLRRSPARLELARALLDLGAAHRRAGMRGHARELLRESLDLAHALGGLALADRARRELVTAGSRPRRDAMRGRDALTPSELRVAQLAAGGQTNRQIAQALFVTQRTVENHLTSTYGKLGISSRPELAAALAGRRANGGTAAAGTGQIVFMPNEHGASGR
jgi:DNA-binding CsgD family transcriptional regulator/tetratricopeptide (TPR) repeat protein